MSLSSEDIKNAERWAKDYGNQMTNGGMMSHSMFVGYLKRAVIFGMEYQITKQRSPIHPIEQVGEKHWRIKDGHE